MTVLKVLSQEVTLATTTSNTVVSSVHSASLVRVVNIATETNHVVTQSFANGQIKSTFTVLKSTEVNVQKLPTDLLAVDLGTDIVATSIAFAN